MASKSTSSPKKNRWLAVINILAFVLVVLTNYLAVSLPLNNKTTGELARKYENMFNPASVTFSIWSVIYIFLAGFVVYQAYVLFGGRRGRRRITAISPWFIINCLANVAWLFAWHYQQVPLSVIIMLVLLFTLIAIHRELHLALSWKNVNEKLWLDIPFSIYLGWITVATMANITSLFVLIEEVPFGLSAPTWTIILIGIGTLLTLWMISAKKNFFFALVICWAFVGIIIKRRQEASADSSEVILAAQVCIGILVLAMVVMLFMQRRQLDR